MRKGRWFELSDAQAARWASIREGGRRRYIVLTGVFGWGLLTALLSTVAGQLTGAPGPFPGRLAIALVMFPLSGILWGALMWSLGERRYLEWSVKSR